MQRTRPDHPVPREDLPELAHGIPERKREGEPTPPLWR